MRRTLALLTVIALCCASCSGDDSGRRRQDHDRETEGATASERDTERSASTAAIAPGLPDVTTVSCPPTTVAVATAEDLTEALASAAPGDVIGLADGTYEGVFVASATASADAPIYVCGSREAVIDGGGVKAGYGFHLDGAAGWRLVGFTVRNAQKGVMADGTSDSVIQGLLVEHIGDEAIHLRAFSTGNVVRGNEIHDTGLRRDKFGEGVYIGSAVSNWGTHSGGEPDRSDGNVVEGNRIWDTSSESVDIKEGTTGGVLRGNSFDGAAMTGADSWVDVKGNAWLIENNVGANAPLDGFQLHEIEEGWGTGNTFTRNMGQVDADGYGINTTNTDGNTVSCDNDFTGAAEGPTNIPCTD